MTAAFPEKTATPRRSGTESGFEKAAGRASDAKRRPNAALHPGRATTGGPPLCWPRCSLRSSHYSCGAHCRVQARGARSSSSGPQDRRPRPRPESSWPARGWSTSPRLFAAYLRLVRPSLALAGGPASASRPRSRPGIWCSGWRGCRRARKRTSPSPEGYNYLQVGQRLQQLGICSARAFQRGRHEPEAARIAAHPRALGGGLSVPGHLQLPRR